MEFSFKNYQYYLSHNIFYEPVGFVPYISIDKVQYRKIEKEHEEKNNCCATAFKELSQRVSQEYYHKVYPIQSRTLDYAQMAFPAYKFVLPEVLADDWLAIVDWHKYQRDHALHQPLTAYIVLKLLGFGESSEALSINNNNLLDLCVDEIIKWNKTRYLKGYLYSTNVFDHNNHNLWLGNETCSKELWKILFVEAAYLAAVFHDMGYPWEYINTLSSKLDYSGCQQDDIPSDDADNIIRKYGQRLLFYPLNGYQALNANTPSTWQAKLRTITAKALRETHGFPGAISFLYFNDVLSEFPILQNRPLRQFCIEWAATAIMMHDMGKIYWGKKEKDKVPENPHLRLRFDVDPLSCVIALADVLEDFERPVIAFSSEPECSIGCYRTACKSSLLECSNGKLTIKYMMNSIKDKVIKIQFMQKDCKEYFDSNSGYVDLSGCGIHSVEMEAVV